MDSSGAAVPVAGLRPAASDMGNNRVGPAALDAVRVTNPTAYSMSG